MVGLDLVPEFIPPDVSDALFLPIREDRFINRLLGLNCRLHIQRNTESFVDEFDRLFVECIVRFLGALHIEPVFGINSKLFQSIRSLVRDKFRKRLFPYNNEKISQGEILRKRVISPLLHVLRRNGIEMFSAVDEFGLISVAKHVLNMNSEDLRALYPRLDYVQMFETSLSFRSAYASRLEGR
jgi:hypothetical protein